MFNILTSLLHKKSINKKSDIQNYTKSDIQNYTKSDIQNYTKKSINEINDVTELFKYNYNINCNINKKKKEDEDRRILLEATNEAEELYRNILDILKNGHTNYRDKTKYRDKTIKLCNTLLNERLPMFDFTHKYYLDNNYYHHSYHNWEWSLIEQIK